MFNIIIHNLLLKLLLHYILKLVLCITIFQKLKNLTNYIASKLTKFTYFHNNDNNNNSNDIQLYETSIIKLGHCFVYSAQQRKAGPSLWLCSFETSMACVLENIKQIKLKMGDEYLHLV